MILCQSYFTNQPKSFNIALRNTKFVFVCLSACHHHLYTSFQLSRAHELCKRHASGVVVVIVKSFSIYPTFFVLDFKHCAQAVPSTFQNVSGYL